MRKSLKVRLTALTCAMLLLALIVPPSSIAITKDVSGAQCPEIMYRVCKWEFNQHIYLKVVYDIAGGASWGDYKYRKAYVEADNKCIFVHTGEYVWLYLYSALNKQPAQWSRYLGMSYAWDPFSKIWQSPENFTLPTYYFNRYDDDRAVVYVGDTRYDLDWNVNIVMP